MLHCITVYLTRISYLFTDLLYLLNRNEISLSVLLSVPVVFKTHDLPMTQVRLSDSPFASTDAILTNAIAVPMDAKDSQPSFDTPVDRGNSQPLLPSSRAEALPAAVKHQERLMLLPNLAAPEMAESRFLELLQQGNALAQQEAISAAIETYRQALQLKPNSVEAHQYLAQALSKQGDLEEAAVCYRKAIELATDQLTEANAALDATASGVTSSGASGALNGVLQGVLNGASNGASNGALNGASDASQIEQPQNPYIRVRKVRKKAGAAAESSAVERQEEREMEEMSDKLPWFEEAAFYIQQGKTHCNSKNWDAAITACQQALDLMAPKTAETFYMLGQALQGKGNLDEARQSYRKSLMLQPDDAEVYAYLGSVYAAQKQWKEAMNCYQQAIARNPNFAEAYWEMGELWQKQGDANQATNYWYQALQLKPTWATAREHWRLGTALTEQGKLEQAVLSYEAAIVADPAFAEAYHNLGIVLGQQSKWQTALTYHRQAVERSPKSAQLWAGLGRALIALENWEEAISTYQRVIQLTVDAEAQGYAVFQHALAQLEQCQKAMVAKSYYNMAEGLNQRQKWQEAVSCYRQAIHRYPNSSQFFAGLGKALAGQEQWQEAISAYQRAMELAPQNTDYYRAFGEVLIRREQSQQKRLQQNSQQNPQQNPQQNSQPQLQPSQAVKQQPDQTQDAKADAKLDASEKMAFTLV